MAVEAKNLCSSLMNASTSYTTTTNYTVPSGKKTLLKYISITNTTATTAKIRVYIVPSGGSPSTANALFYTTSIAANARVEWPTSSGGVIVMSEGDTIRSASYATGVNINANGVEIT